MVTERKTSDDVLGIVLKNPFANHTITSIAKQLHKTRQGVWRVLNALEKEGLVLVEQVQKTRTSTALIMLNWKSPITEQTTSLLLTKESIVQERWRVNFEELKPHVEFLILFGSILHSPKEANDIDILAVVQKKKFKIVEHIVMSIQKTQEKKIHLIDTTKEEFKKELKKPNETYREILRKGVVLYGQENFTRYIRGMGI